MNGKEFKTGDEARKKNEKDPLGMVYLFRICLYFHIFPAYLSL